MNCGMLNGETLNTKWGTAKINKAGYYVITSSKEGNHMKILHRLIAEEYFGDWINDSDDFFDIHHIDENKLNNCVLNLEPITHEDHLRFHNIGNKHPSEVIEKLSKGKLGKNNPMYGKTGELHPTYGRKGELSPMYGKHHPIQHCKELSKKRNNSGYFRVGINKTKNCRQGFVWRYTWIEHGKQKGISSTSLEKLKEKVLSNSLEWFVIDEDKALSTCKEYGYDFEELC